VVLLLMMVRVVMLAAEQRIQWVAVAAVEDGADAVLRSVL
jgi:hypothetical protein